jgi:hypothetical protein
MPYSIHSIRLDIVGKNRGARGVAKKAPRPHPPNDGGSMTQATCSTPTRQSPRNCSLPPAVLWNQDLRGVA